MHRRVNIIIAVCVFLMVFCSFLLTRENMYNPLGDRTLMVECVISPGGPGSGRQLPEEFGTLNFTGFFVSRLYSDRTVIYSMITLEQLDLYVDDSSNYIQWLTAAEKCINKEMEVYSFTAEVSEEDYRAVIDYVHFTSKNFDDFPFIVSLSWVPADADNVIFEYNNKWYADSSFSFPEHYSRFRKLGNMGANRKLEEKMHDKITGFSNIMHIHQDEWLEGWEKSK